MLSEHCKLWDERIQLFLSKWYKCPHDEKSFSDRTSGSVGFKPTPFLLHLIWSLDLNGLLKRLWADVVWLNSLRGFAVFTLVKLLTDVPTVILFISLDSGGDRETNR